jgi:four helix bundle protein
VLPHHRLIAFHVAKELLLAVKDAQISELALRDQAADAAGSAVLNCCEGAAAGTAGEKRRAFAIARREGAEAAGAVEVAVLKRKARSGSDLVVNRIAGRLVALLGPLAR